MSTDTVITPQSIQIPGTVGIGQRLRVSFRHIACGGCVFFVELGHTRHCRNIIRIIEVKAGFACHRQNSAGVYIHDDTGSVVGAVSLVLMIL